MSTSPAYHRVTYCMVKTSTEKYISGFKRSTHPATKITHQDSMMSGIFIGIWSFVTKVNIDLSWQSGTVITLYLLPLSSIPDINIWDVQLVIRYCFTKALPQYIDLCTHVRLGVKSKPLKKSNRTLLEILLCWTVSTFFYMVSWLKITKIQND